jgi:hypothetical protein
MSRRRTVSLAVVVFAALASVLAPSVRAGGPYDYTTGGGHRATGGTKGATFAFSAHNGPGGPSGEYTRSGSNGSIRITAAITCLQVTGNRALLGGVIRRSNDPSFPAGTTVALAVEDNGNPAGGVSPDRVSFTDFTGAPPPINCSDEAFLFALLQPVADGNVGVYDAP